MFLPAKIGRLHLIPRIVLCAAVLLQGCSSVALTPPEEAEAFSVIENAGNFGPRPQLLVPEDIHRLSADQAGPLLAFMKAPENASYKRHERLAQYLKKITLEFEYEADTLPAAMALELNHGNCLTLAIVTTALAKIADLEIGYQLMDDVPVFELDGTVITKGVHVRSIIYDPDWVAEEGKLILTRPGSRIDYFPTDRERFIRNIREEDYLAMYYRNMAGAAIATGDFNSAYWHAIESLQYEPDNAPAINMLAVINRRAGNLQIAERLYLFGIEHADDKLSLLKNYHVLLTNSGRISEANEIKKQLDAMDDPSPFHWFNLARVAHDAGDYAEAIRYYNRAIELAPYLHEAYLGVAQSNYDAGQRQAAAVALEAALDKVRKASTRNLYQAKLDALSKELHR